VIRYVRLVGGKVVLTLRACLIVPILLAFPMLCFAGVISIKNSSAAFRPGATAGGESNWTFSTPTARDTITWTSGENHTDGVSRVKMSYGPETKFDFTGGSPASRTFTGFKRDDGPGPRGSTTHTEGSGD